MSVVSDAAKFVADVSGAFVVPCQVEIDGRMIGLVTVSVDRTLLLEEGPMVSEVEVGISAAGDVVAEANRSLTGADGCVVDCRHSLKRVRRWVPSNIKVRPRMSLYKLHLRRRSWSTLDSDRGSTASWLGGLGNIM